MFGNDDKYRVPTRVEQALAEALADLDDAHRRYRDEAPKGPNARHAAEWRVNRARLAVDKALAGWRWHYEAAGRRADRDAA